MNRFRIVLVLTLIALSLVFSGCYPKPDTTGTTNPVIDAYFASPHIQSGEFWKIYVKAHDPDGNMWLMRYSAEGQGMPLQTSQMRLPEKMWKEFNGYFYVQGKGLFATTLKLTLQFEDKGKRTSEKITVTVKSGKKKSDSPPAGFDQKNRLLAIPVAKAGSNK